MKRFILRCVLLMAALCSPVCALAQHRLEIIPLQHRLPDQVLPSLQTMLEPGGTITAANNRLFVRTSPTNLVEIRMALAALDTPLRRLMISVRQGSSAEAQAQGAGVTGGRIVIGADGSVRAAGEARVDQQRTQRTENAQQQVQTVEGAEASIFLGRSLPLPMRQTFIRPDGGVQIAHTVQYVDVGSGFMARADLIGARVRLSISPQMQQINQGGVISGSRLSTQIEGRLGEWIALGGARVERQDGQRGLLSGQSTQNLQSGEVWLKVEVLE